MSETVTQPAPRTTSHPIAKDDLRARILRVLSTYSTLWVVLALLVIFGATSDKFLSSGNLINIVKQASVVAVVGIGMTLVILIGGIDLSVGSVVLLTSGTAAVLMASFGFGALPAILVGLAIGAVVGLANGVIVEIVGISPVIATLGMLIALKGLGQIVINNTWVFVTNPFFEAVATERFLFLPLLVWIMLILYAIMAVVMQRTRFGHYIYAIGNNSVAARLAGLPVLRLKILVYVLCGFFAAIAGMMTAAELGLVGPPVGSGVEFDAIAAVVLGGTRLGGGIGRVERTLLGAVMLAMVLNYMTLRGVPDVWQATVTGFIVLGAVLLDRFARRTPEA